MNQITGPTGEEPLAVDDLDAFKQAFRRHAAGVAAVTSLDPQGKPVGFTATSLASLAAVPPMATFNMSQVASAYPAMTVGNHVAIHMLGPRSRHIAEKLAADHDVRFAGDHWTPGPHGLPILSDVTAWMVGTVLEVHPVHNNAVIVVQIETGALGPEDEALLYHERSYMKPGAIDA
ncbi:flavin reductase family protein [Glaciihabitans sp. dw_435]|uniref:flavin reductase family protein n=1 Tax=Glaciihabitans sp. dw_435 TaxID=2720081 RepID=UPI001BD3F331|nr:flavin reductase family protein [Glaciihabitans sp. dw_435]